jgi:hypothetical protein
MWPVKLAAPQEDITTLLREYLNYRAEWHQQRSACLVKTSDQWHASFNADVEDKALRQECNRRGRNYGMHFEAMHNMTLTERDQYVASRWAKDRVRTYRAFVYWFDGMKNDVCVNNLTGGWTAPFDESIIIRTSNR